MPKLSIITPVYCDTSQKVDWLGEMIQSVQSQTMSDWEIVLINDKSPLPLDSVKMQYAGDDRLRWIENAKNYGPAMTRNTAVALAESECILPLDADDMLASEEVLEHMYDVWSIDQTKIIYGNLQMYTQVANNIFQRGKVIQLGEYTFELAMNLNGIMPVSAMHSKECHYEAGGWKHVMHGGLEDVEYWIAAGKRGYCGQKINHTTLIYRKQESSRAYKMQFIDKNFREMQNKIKELHSDIYAGRFPMACCGKGGSTPVVNDPVIISQQAQAQVRIVTALEGYDEKDLEWVAYRGPKQGRSGSILTRGPANTPAEYPILGTGHVFQIHKRHNKLFADRQRLGFVMNEPDPRQRTEPKPEPVIQPAIVNEPEVTEVPKPQMSTIVRLDAVASGTREVELQPIPDEVIIEPDPPESISYAVSDIDVSVLRLGKKLTDTLYDAGYAVEKLAEITPEELSRLPGIGIKRANRIITRAQEYLEK